MPNKQRIDVFISSTSIDLPEHRDAVYKALLRMGLFPNGMEIWPAGDESPVALCRRMVDDAEIYIGIYAHRYGWRPDGASGKSITEMEYDWATARGIPRLCFVMDKTHPWPTDKIEFEAKPDLDAFKTRVQERVVGFFTTPDNLRAQVVEALAQLSLVRENTFLCNRVPRPPLFAGRADELAALETALAGNGTVAITAIRGIGGIGKTTLAQQLAHVVGDQFGLRLWASLGKDFREDTVPRYLREWAGQDFPPQMSVDEMARATKAILTGAARDQCGEPVLVVIDDVWADTVKSARLLRDAAPDGARFLITTRSEDVAAALNARSRALQFMPPEEGAALLLEHLSDTRAADHLPLLQELSHVLGGHPLALTLAARPLRSDLNERRLRRAIDRFRSGIDSGDPFGHLKLDAGDDKVDSVSVTLRQTLDAIGGTDAALKARRQSQFRALGALLADLPFRLEHVRALWGELDGEDLTPLDEDEVDDALRDLCAEGLLTPDPDRDDWYGQHRLLRAYARALLRETPDFDAATARHRRYIIKRARGVFVERQNQPETWGEITDDLPQIHALGDELVALLSGTTDPTEADERLRALNQSPADDAVGTTRASSAFPDLKNASPDLLQACQDFAFIVRNYIFRRYIGTEGRRWLWAGLIAAYVRDSKARVRLFTGELGLWHDQQGYKQAALAYYQQSLEMAVAQDDKRNQATTLNNIGLVWSALGEKAKALEYYERALPLRVAVGDRGGEATTLNNIGGVWRRSGEHHKALEYYERALPLRVAVGDRGGEAVTLTNIGAVWSALGEKAKALEYYERALPLVQAVGDRGGEATTLNNIGEVWRGLGEHQKALEYYERALPLRVAVGDRGGEAVTLNNIGAVWDDLGEKAKALEYYERALPLLQAVGDITVESITRYNMALIFWEQGERGKGLEYMQIARHLNARIGISTQDEDNYLAQWRAEMGE